jgi:predicted dienelactone hydrolase
MSHGNGGGFAGHWDTAVALARAGFVAAALTHSGDNWRDQSRAVNLPERPRQLKVLVDYMLGRWPGHGAIDAARVGAFGFSAGGFSVLALAGGEPDLGSIGPHCAAHPDVYDCQLIKRFAGAADAIARARPVWTHDTRIRAVVSAAPAVGFAFGTSGLATLTMPIQLWRAELDHVLPQPDYAEAVRDALPTPPDYHVVPGADHYDFLVPCNDAMRRNAPIICQSPAGFDRAAFHEAFNRDVVAFFERTLGT